MDIGEHNQIVKDELRAKIKELEAEVDKLLKWVHDLQSGMFINCVYCGHRYGPNDEIPATMADILKEHVEQCPKHPMSALKAERDELRAKVRQCDHLAFKVAVMVQLRKLGTRSAVADELLNYLNVGGVDGPVDIPSWVEQYKIETDGE